MDSQSQTTSLLKLINPTERQYEFLRAIAEKDFVLYGGEAGGGKSYILRWWLIWYLIWCYTAKGLKNVQVALLCEDYPSLTDRQVSKIRFEFPQWLGKLQQGAVLNFRLNPEYGSGILALRNLDDPSKYYSSEFAAIAVDELTRNKKEIFDMLRFRLRWPGIERPKFAAGTNPGGPGHEWVKKLWVTKKYPEELRGIAEQFELVRAKASDNPHLPASYHERLLTLPPEMAKQVAKGDWDVYTGQFFPNFDEQRHVIRERDFQPRPWWTRWISGDWGFEHPSCIHWHCRDEQGHVYTYRELYGRQINESSLGQRISELSAGEKLSSFFFSWDAFGRMHESNRYSIADMVARNLSKGVPRPTPADASPGERIVGWRLMSQLLDAEQWTITTGCPKLIECLPTLIRDEDKPEDVLKVDWTEMTLGDDAADSARYGLKMMLSPRPVPKDVQKERLNNEFIEQRERIQRVRDLLRSNGHGAQAEAIG